MYKCRTFFATILLMTVCNNKLLITPRICTNFGCRWWYCPTSKGFKGPWTTFIRIGNFKFLILIGSIFIILSLFMSKLLYQSPSRWKTWRAEDILSHPISSITSIPISFHAKRLVTRLCFATWEFARQLHIAHYAAKSKASGFRRSLACVSEPTHPNYTRNVRTSISRRSRKIADQVFSLPALLALFCHVIRRNLTNFTSTPVL